jgi:uncharacterized damage-inducible protein DinB
LILNSPGWLKSKEALMVNRVQSIDLPQPGGNQGQLKDWIAGLEAARDQLEALVIDLPGAALIWQPLSSAQSIGSLLLQIVRTEESWLGEGTEEANEQAVSGRSLNWYLDRLRSARAHSLRKLSQLTSLDQICERRDREGETESRTLGWVLWRLLEQHAHHRGQIELLKQWYLQAHAPVYA